MMRRVSTGRMKRACALLVAIGTLCTMLPATGFAESHSTSASVEFTSESAAKPVPPVDPDRPGREDPLSPDHQEGGTVTISNGEYVPVSELARVQRVPGATGAAGWLSINYVTPLMFGTEIEDGIFTVQQERPYLQTSDLRGTASGWKVTAIAGPFQNPGDMAPIPALLSFSDGSPNSAHTYFEPPEIPDLIELPANGSTQRLIEFADEDKGVGVWVARWYPVHGAAQDFQLRLFSPVSNGRLGFVLWVMNDAP